MNKERENYSSLRIDGEDYDMVPIEPMMNVNEFMPDGPMINRDLENDPFQYGTYDIDMGSGYDPYGNYGYGMYGNPTSGGYGMYGSPLEPGYGNMQPGTINYDVTPGYMYGGVFPQDSFGGTLAPGFNPYQYQITQPSPMAVPNYSVTPPSYDSSTGRNMTKMQQPYGMGNFAGYASGQESKNENIKVDDSKNDENYRSRKKHKNDKDYNHDYDNDYDNHYNNDYNHDIGEVRRVMRKIRRYNQGIYRAMRAYGIPYPVANTLIRRIVRLSLIYSED